MGLKQILFSIRIYRAKLSGLANGLAEGIILLAALASFFTLVYQFGFVQTEANRALFYSTHITILSAFFVGITLRNIVRFKEVVQERLLYLDIGIYSLLVWVLAAELFFKQAISESLPYLTFLTHPVFVYILVVLLSIIHLSRQTFALMQSHIKPSMLFLLSFVFVILVGAGLLMLPNATHHGIPYIDALFISTTSVCVTGLTTVPVGSTFTTIGLVVILLLIQIGGIGVMTFTSFFALSFMGQSSLSSKMMLKNILNEERIGDLFRVILNILFVTLLIEGVGAYLIYLDIEDSFPGGMREKLFFCIFHAVSAFCNAGISTLDGNLYDPMIAHHPNIKLWVGTLILLGGLGFPILFNYLKLLHHQLLNWLKVGFRQQSHYIHTPRIVRLHTYIVVISTLVLVIGGTALYLFFEANNSLQGLSLREKLSAAYVGAVTPRTAGFNVADMTTLTPPTLVMTFLLMVIGAGPMSTAGGLKVTTVVVALLATFSAARSKEKVEIRGREIAPFAIRRAFAIIVLYMVYAMGAVCILSYTERGADPFTLMFEVVSALSTVGLSLDYTPSLTTVGKMVIICTMLVGRIGVLTFFVSFCKEYTKKNYSYPEENILM